MTPAPPRSTVRDVKLAAIALLAAGGVLSVLGTARQDTTTITSAIAARAGAPSASAQPDVVPEATLPPAMVGGEIPDGYRIQIPRLGIDLPLREGDVKRDIEEQLTPENYAFHLPGTAIPGQNGNAFLYAHARRGMFLALWDVRAGDEVLIWAPAAAVRVYIVRDILPRVAPTDVSMTRPIAGERLTLQTSTGPSPGDARFVVVAFAAYGAMTFPSWRRL